MKLKALLNDDEERAVSPVIGVILMVAITVILAAVIGTFVLGLGDQIQATAPSAQFDFDQSNHSSSDTIQVEVSFSSGQGIDPARLSLSSDSSNAVLNNPTEGNWTGTNDQGMVAAGAWINASNSSETGFSEGDTVDIIWNAEGGGQSDTLASHTVS